uniref:Cell wall protein-like n=1 Tax=Oryza sativa subsp. japonica TaxID=39947 RepID=Q6Z453_ORYSJ|nr:hypothetical protein [Oryza sativa Japonica Group]BAD30852.1 hypothetical protein [Oryza sativa Japonica Group]
MTPPAWVPPVRRVPDLQPPASSSLSPASSSPACPLFHAETSRSASLPATVALPPLFRLRPPLPRPLCAGRRRHHLSRHRNAVLFPGQATASPEFRQNAVARTGLSFLLVDVSSGSPFCHARASAGAAVPSLGTPPVPPRPCTGRPHLNHLRHRSGVFRAVLVSVQLLPAALIASSLVPVVVLSSFPVVVAPVVVFVLGSVSSSLVLAASRLRARIAAEVVPSPFASVVPEPSPSRSFVFVVPTPHRMVLLSFRRFSKRGLRSSPKVRKAVLSEQGKSHHP